MPCMSKGLELKVRIFEKNYERKRKEPFIIYADFKSILVPEDNGKQNPEESYTIQKL